MLVQITEYRLIISVQSLVTEIFLFVCLEFET